MRRLIPPKTLVESDAYHYRGVMRGTTKKTRRAVIVTCAAALVSLGIAAPSGASPAAPFAADPKPSVQEAPTDITGDGPITAERHRIRGVLGALGAFDGGSVWEPTTSTLNIQLTSDLAVQEAAKLIEAAKPSIKIKLTKVAYTANELESLSDQLLTNQENWAGARGIGGGYDPIANRVILQVDRAYKDSTKLIDAVNKLKDPRVRLETLDGVKGWAPESRTNDVAPWTSGGAIDSSTSLCTSGWAWKMWGSNEVVGSTARHCANLYWYNNGSYVGTVFQSTPVADSAFMRGSTYSATVFVGGTDTYDLRRVVGAVSSWSAGDSVAMSGRASGLNVTTVRFPTYTLPSCAGEYAGLQGVLMQTHPTMPGDSGGPWLTTQYGTGYALAHGQHFGGGCLTGYTGSFFIKVSTISSQQKATLLTAP